MKTFKLPLVALATLATAACGDLGSILGTPITLSASEVNTLFLDIRTIFDGADLTVSRTGAPMTARVAPGPTLDLLAAIQATVNCAGGGTAVFSGTTSSDASSVNATATFKGCATPHYTIDGSFVAVDNVTSNGFIDTRSGDLTITTTDSRSGTCHVDVTITETGNTTTVTGTMCGVTASSITAIS